MDQVRSRAVTNLKYRPETRAFVLKYRSIKRASRRGLCQCTVRHLYIMSVTCSHQSEISPKNKCVTLCIIAQRNVGLRAMFAILDHAISRAVINLKYRPKTCASRFVLSPRKWCAIFHQSEISPGNTCICFIISLSKTYVTSRTLSVHGSPSLHHVSHVQSPI